jgi:cyclic pyranopterin phosphate synthase
LAFLDSFGREHDDLRISVTDRCNLRCTYCMPEEPVWFPKAAILSYEEIVRIVRILLRRGPLKIRITGGEPLLRRDLPVLVHALAHTDGVVDLSLTTNGVLLAGAVADLVAAGLKRINVSVDTLDRERFRKLTGRDQLDAVLAGLAAAERAGFSSIKVNTVLLRGTNDDEAETLVATARERGWELRFIEFMPMENGEVWDLSQVVTGAELRARIGARWPLVADPGADPKAPAARYLFADGRGAVGFIDSVTRPFCATCSRIRLTSDGKFRVCLYDTAERDLRDLLRGGAGDDEIDAVVRDAILKKGRGGALEVLATGARIPLERTMHQIGG